MKTIIAILSTFNRWFRHNGDEHHMQWPDGHRKRDGTRIDCLSGIQPLRHRSYVQQFHQRKRAHCQRVHVHRACWNGVLYVYEWVHGSRGGQADYRHRGHS